MKLKLEKKEESGQFEVSGELSGDEIATIRCALMAYRYNSSDAEKLLQLFSEEMSKAKIYD